MEIPKRQILQALSRLKYLDDFKEVTTWLTEVKNRRAVLTNQLTDTNAMLRSQGAYAQIEEILKFISDPETYLGK